MARKRNYPKKDKQVSKENPKEPVTNEESTTTDEKKDSGPKTNDPEWYAQDPQLLIDSASLNFSDPLGSPVKLAGGPRTIAYDGTDHSWFIPSNAKYNDMSIPGICTLFIKHSIGSSINRNDPANVAADAFYTHVRYVNSGRKNYDPSDLMMYALAIGDLYAFIQWCKRLYAYGFMYSQTNQYVGKALIEENCVNPDNLLINLANFRYWINTFINKIASFVLPNDIPYFARRRFMYDGLYIENPMDNLKDQLYQFVPEGFYKFQLGDNGFGKLSWQLLTRVCDTTTHDIKTRTPAQFLTVDDIASFGEGLIANIMGDEDFGLMSGDILKAYGDRIVALETLPSEYYVLPHYDLTVLSQFKNATIIDSCRAGQYVTQDSYHISGDLSSTHRYGDIEQDINGNIVSLEGIEIADPSTGATAQYTKVWSAAINKLLNSELPAPGPADNIEATRLTVTGESDLGVFDPSGNAEKEFLILTCGVDYVTSCVTRYNVWKDHGTSSEHDWRWEAGSASMESSIIDSSNIDAFTVERWNGFKYMPFRYPIALVESDHKKLNGVRIWGNVDNYTILQNHQLYKMHMCALLSLFYVPGVAKLINYIRG